MALSLPGSGGGSGDREIPTSGLKATRALSQSAAFVDDCAHNNACEQIHPVAVGRPWTVWVGAGNRD